MATGIETSYHSPTGVPLDRAAEQQGLARELAVDIRSEESAGELATRLADDLEQLAEALDFAIEFANNADHPALIVEIPRLTDALHQVSSDASDLMDAAS